MDINPVVLSAFAKGVMIVKPEFLTGCQSLTRLLCPELFEWTLEDIGKDHNETILDSLKAYQHCRLHIKATGVGIFHEWKALIYFQGKSAKNVAKLVFLNKQEMLFKLLISLQHLKVRWWFVHDRNYYLYQNC